MTKGKSSAPAIRPLNGRIVVEQSSAETRTSGGLYIPREAQNPPQVGTVVAVGDPVPNEYGVAPAVQVAVGDRVLFSKYAGGEVVLDGHTLFIMQASDAIAVLPPDAKVEAPHDA